MKKQDKIKVLKDYAKNYNIDKLKRVEIIAPFNGFYNTLHGGKIESMVEVYCTDDNGEAIKGEEEKVNWKKTQIAYCKHWVCELLGLFDNNELTKGIDIKFKDLESPKFYNFENDRLVMEIDLISIQKIRDLIIKDYSTELEKELKEKFTPCSGFIPFYPNNTREFLEKKSDCNTRAVFFRLFIENVLDNNEEDLKDLIDYGNIEIIFNDDTEKEK